MGDTLLHWSILTFHNKSFAFKVHIESKVPDGLPLALKYSKLDWCPASRKLRPAFLSSLQHLPLSACHGLGKLLSQSLKVSPAQSFGQTLFLDFLYELIQRG